MIKQKIYLSNGLEFMELRLAEMQVCYIQKKIPQNTIPVITGIELILREFQVVDLGEIGAEKRGADLEDQEQGGLLCKELVTLKRIDDEQVICAETHGSVPVIDLHISGEDKADLVVLMDMRSPVEHIVEENLVTGQTVRNDLIFCNHGISSRKRRPIAN